ncbi:hypothetical protein Taro_034217 [Colocasia esculenta]|uniref:Uncharacterized protein n=1 Tax=Colocasia esculenta TaxID=4460 RepID=A0A843W2A8_COLES|nr:hypothetical protein [Colocasia esculenta]
MEQIESEIRRVLQDHNKISASIRSEEARIDAVSKEIRSLDGVLGAPDVGALERQRMQNLLSYQSTLIERAASRTELLRALHDDLLLLFLRRKQLRQADYVAALGIEIVPNLSPSSGLSIGNDNNDVIQNDCSIPAPLDIVTMSDGQDNFQELTTEQVQLPLGLKMPEINVDEDACLTPEHNDEYSDIQYKNNVSDDITMSILDMDANVASIFKEMMDTSDIPSAEIQNARRMSKKMGRVAYHNLGRRLSVDFDEFGNPTGPNAGAFKRSVNSFVCHLLPVRFKQIGDVPAEDYKAVLNVLTERYNFDPIKSYTRKKISSCYRQHKYKLLIQVKKDLERGIEPQKPSYVKKEDWDVFVAKTKDEEFDRISKKNKVSRSHQTVSRKGLPSSLQKRKLVPEGDLIDDYIWGRMHKPKRGRPRKPSALPSDLDNFVDNMEFCIDQEGYGTEQSSRSGILVLLIRVNAVYDMCGGCFLPPKPIASRPISAFPFDVASSGGPTPPYGSDARGPTR